MDNPKPAAYLAEKLFVDFVKQATKKIDYALNQEQIQKDRLLTASLQRIDDPIYDQILDGIGAISEFCLPSLLEILIKWFNHQLDAADDNRKSHSQTASSDNTAPNTSQNQPIQSNVDEHSLNCVSPSNENASVNNNSGTIRSPTPSSPDTSYQMSITSVLPLEHQSTSLTIIEQSRDQSSAANTSTSVATNASSNSLPDNSMTCKFTEADKTRRLLIEYVFCQALIEIFGQLHLHPGYDDLIKQVEDIAFCHFKCDETISSSNATVDSANIKQLSDKFAEVIGVLARNRFKNVKKRFFFALNDLRAKDPTPTNIQSIVTLLASMKFFRVKMAPIEEFEASIQFLQELADYFLEVRHKSIKHALASLFVEIMVPLASMVKNEVKIPCLKNLVEALWAPTFEMCSRKKHSVTLFPLVTCLLCISHRPLFLTNWSNFLTMSLSNLKNRDQKLCRIALESLYRLVWIYMMRVKCESNNVTQNRLHSIVDALFPRGSRQIVPRDSPMQAFVDIIQFIAQERLDFAMRHIIFELLSVDRPVKVIVAPERMNIGLRAFLAILDSLQHKEAEPVMPISIGTSTLNSPVHEGSAGKHISSNGLRRSQMNKMLNDDVAKSIGLYPYHAYIQKAFNDILRALDTQYGRPLLLTALPSNIKDPEDRISNETRPKVELFKTCIAAIPKLIPIGMTKAELIDLLSRMTVHVDEGMRKNAFESLQNLVIEHQEWRLDVIEGFTIFLAKNIDESLRHLVDNALKMLLHLLISWRGIITPSNNDSSARAATVHIQTGYESISSHTGGAGGQITARKNRALNEMRLIQSELANMQFDKLISVIQKVEAASFVMLCSCHQPTRKLATYLLREGRTILKRYSTWTCMEQLGFKSPEEIDEEDLSASLKGSLSADNLSRITATSANGPAHSSVTSMNTQTMLSTSVSKLCITNTVQPATNSVSHDPYDTDIENNLTDCFTNDENSTLIFWFALILLESDNEQQYMFALKLLKNILPDLPFEQEEFLDELDTNLRQMGWQSFPGIHSLVLKGCASSNTYDLSISLLDHLTPILKHSICTANTRFENSLPFHVMALTTHLLSNYDDPTPFSLNVARRIALCCDEHSQKLENLSAVMTLYSRRSFSKDSFQWIKCIAKYLHDVCPNTLPTVIPILIDILETGPLHIQRLIIPILYCILTYTDVNNQPNQNLNANLERLYIRTLGTEQWRDALQIFKLIISRSSVLTAHCKGYGRELPGRTMSFDIDVERMVIIGRRSQATT